MKGQAQKAIKEYRKLIEANPKDKRLYLKVGDLYLKEGQTEQAIKEYSKVADLYVEEDLNSLAISIYKKVLSIDPKMIEAMHKIAGLYIKEGLVGSARGYYQSILRIRPDDSEARKALANPPPVDSPREEPLFTPVAEPRASAHRFNPETKTVPEPDAPTPPPPLEVPDLLMEPEEVSVDKDSEMHYHLGIAYKEMELYDYAISEFEMASSSLAMKFDCYIMLGDCYIEKGLHDKSIECYKVAAEVKGLSDEKMARLHFNLGLAYEANGMATEAIQAFSAVLKFDRSMAEAQEKIKKLQKSPSL